MKVRKIINLDIAKKLDGTVIGNRRFEFQFDGNGDLIFSGVVLEDQTWADIKEELLKNSEEIEYVSTEGKESNLANISDKYQNVSK